MLNMMSMNLCCCIWKGGLKCETYRTLKKTNFNEVSFESAHILAKLHFSKDELII